jgi:hypothetical protein
MIKFSELGFAIAKSTLLKELSVPAIKFIISIGLVKDDVASIYASAMSAGC